MAGIDWRSVRASRRTLALVVARSAARRGVDDSKSRGRERRRGDLGRGHRRVVPLARRARQRNRLGRDSHGASWADRPRRERLARDRRPRSDATRALRLRARPRRRAPRLVRRAGERRDAERGRRGDPARRRLSSSRRRNSPRAVDDARVGEPRPRAPRGGVRRRRGGGRRSTPPAQAPRTVGARARAASPASPTRCCAPPCCTASSSSGFPTSKDSLPSARLTTSPGCTTRRSS